MDSGPFTEPLPPARAAASDRPYAILRNRDFSLYLMARLIAALGQQMLTVAVGWELYERTRSTLALGLVGLTQMVPMVLLILPAGHIADNYERKRTILGMVFLAALSSLVIPARIRGFGMQTLAPWQLVGTAIVFAGLGQFKAAGASEQLQIVPGGHLEHRCVSSFVGVRPGGGRRLDCADAPGRGGLRDQHGGDGDMSDSDWPGAEPPAGGCPGGHVAG